MLPMPTGFEMASEISFVRSICSRILSIVWSTFSTLLHGNQRKALRGKAGAEATYRPEWIPLSASAPFFIATIVSAFKLADSIALTYDKQSDCAKDEGKTVVGVRRCDETRGWQ